MSSAPSLGVPTISLVCQSRNPPGLTITSRPFKQTFSVSPRFSTGGDIKYFSENSPQLNDPRSLSEYLLVLSHGRWISLGFGLFGLGPTLCAHYPPQSTPTLQERRQIFKRLWVKHISCHSADTFSRPRNRNLRIPRADLIMPNTGSTMCLCAA